MRYGGHEPGRPLPGSQAEAARAALKATGLNIGALGQLSPGSGVYPGNRGPVPRDRGSRYEVGGGSCGGSARLPRSERPMGGSGGERFEMKVGRLLGIVFHEETSLSSGSVNHATEANAHRLSTRSCRFRLYTRCGRLWRALVSSPVGNESPRPSCRFGGRVAPWLLGTAPPAPRPAMIIRTLAEPGPWKARLKPG